MYTCSFALNGAAPSPFKIGSLQFDAYSGRPPQVNRQTAGIDSYGVVTVS